MSHSPKELTLPVLQVQIYGTIASIVVFFILSFPFQWIYHRPIFRFEEIDITIGVIMAASFFVGIAVHELIHALTAFVYGKVKPSETRFGFQWKSMTPYFHSKVPIPAGKFRVVAIMPLLLIGVVPYIWAMFLGNGWLVAFGILFILAATGDLLILWLIRDIDSKQLVQDHPEKIGVIITG